METYINIKEDNVMDWLSILQQIFEVCLIPMLGILTTALVQFLT
jgi:hypothetical protein